MQNTAVFETPENVIVSYRIAGPGTRYVAFFVDGFIIFAGMLLIAIVLGIIAIAAAASGSDLLQEFYGMAAVAILVIGFGFVFIGYFAVFELLMHGQTPGKRFLQIRVVNEQGFSLGAGAVLLRSLFRVIDIIPILWLVPLMSAKVQRFGDMAAGTVVVSEEPPRLHIIRERLAARPASEARYSFAASHVRQLRDVDVEATETFLERRDRLHPEQRESLCFRLCRALCTRLDTAMPADGDREVFLEDLLAAYARHESREFV